MKKFTIVYNDVVHDSKREYKFMMVEWIEGEDMLDAAHKHWQSILDENREVEDVIIFEGELNYTTTDELSEIAA